MTTNQPTILLGTAARTINPPQGLPLVGYPSGRPNTGVALDLFARAADFGAAPRSKSAGGPGKDASMTG